MPSMPTLPSRKFSKLWSGGSNKSPSMQNDDPLASEGNDDASEHDSSKETSLQGQLARQSSQDKERQNKEKGGGEGGGGVLARDIEIRRQTNERLYSAAEAYWSSLNKKKSLPFEMNAASALEIAMTLDEAKVECSTTYSKSSSLVSQAAEEGSKNVVNHKEKVFPIEALGLAMASSANTYNRSQIDDSQDLIQLEKNEAYASHLSYLSAVHLALGQLQSEYTSSLSSTLLNRLARSQAAIEALKITEKTAEAAKEKMEAAEKKRDKARDKGEKMKREAEEEARMARATYEEAVADLETRAEILRETEQRGPGSGVAILKEYMDGHLAWVVAQHEVLTKARIALDQYPQSHQETSRPANTRARVAPPPPPPSSQAVNRRVVEPPLPPREGLRDRSSSSPKVSRPSLPSRISQSNIPQQKSSSTKDEKASSDRPSSRGGMVARIPFMRSESYTASNTSTDAIGGEVSNKPETSTKRGRLSSLGATLTRSSSSLALPTSDTSKTTGATSSTGTDYTGSEKGGNWATNLLNRKKDCPYKPMNEDDFTPADNHHRVLSHVKEVSTESRSMMDDDILLTNGFQQQSLPQSSTLSSLDPAWRVTDTNSSTHEGNHDDIIIRNSSTDESNPTSSTFLKPWEKFESRRDSLGVGLHLTGSSSDGGNPFGHDGSELSPMGTGTGFSPFAPKTRMGSIGEPWSQDDVEENDPADGLLGEANRKPGKN